MEIGQGIRQGDVLLIKVAALPKKVREKARDAHGRLVLEYGEVTGHAHAVLEPNAKLYDVLDEAERIVGQALVVEEGSPAILVHEEHDSHVLEPGVYRRFYQVEYDGEEERRVTD